MPPPPSTSRSRSRIAGVISLRVLERGLIACSTLWRASVSAGLRENTVTSAPTLARSSPRMPSRIASSPRFMPP